MCFDAYEENTIEIGNSVEIQKNYFTLKVTGSASGIIRL
jgi:hypothetical protein